MFICSPQSICIMCYKCYHLWNSISGIFHLQECKCMKVVLGQKTCQWQIGMWWYLFVCFLVLKANASLYVFNKTERTFCTTRADFSFRVLRNIKQHNILFQKCPHMYNFHAWVVIAKSEIYQNNTFSNWITIKHSSMFS